MEIYVGRQPIFNRNMDIYGYELLYRRSMNNFYEGEDDTKSTAELIDNAFLSMQFEELTNGTRAFINFSKEMLESEIPFLLPKEAIVVEVLERVEITDRVIEVCRKLHEAGYIIALDDFVYEPAFLPLVEFADIIKIEFSTINDEKQQWLMKEFKYKKIFLAEKVETREDYQKARDLGFKYFQGYFFSKPSIMKAKEIYSINANIVRIINELNQDEPEYDVIAEIIEKDLGLSYKLLKIANSPYYRSLNRIGSIKQALVRFGIDEISKWMYLMMLKEHQNTENRELINLCLLRAKFMEMVSYEYGMGNAHMELFMTGMFSSIDVLLNREMQDILKELPLSPEVQGALLGKNNPYRKILDFILVYETSDWDKITKNEMFHLVSVTKFMEAYQKAVMWVLDLNVIN